VGTGALAPTTNGPRCTVCVELPARSTVRRWNHQRPSPNDGLPADVADAGTSTDASGSDAGALVHETEYPRRPDAPVPGSRPGDHTTRTTRSDDATPTACVTLRTSLGSIGGVRSADAPA